MIPVKTEIVKYGGDDKYRLTIPKDILIGLGWLKQELREKGANEKSKEENRRILVELTPAIVGNYLTLVKDGNGLIVSSKGDIERGFFLKRKVLHTKFKTNPKGYEKRKEGYLEKISNKQKKVRIPNEFYKKLKENKICKFENNKKRNLSKKERGDMLEELENQV